MNTKFRFPTDETARIVYVRAVAVADLPSDIQAEAGDLANIYAVHNSDGERIALVKDKNLAFMLARQNDLAPVNVH